jgi:methylglutaconyl-CoA hydratase
MTEQLTQTIDDRGVATITMTRPDKHNAFDAELITELSRVLGELEANDDVRVVVLTGEGPSFSAGADLNWMRGMAEASEAENRDDARRLAAMLRRLDFLPKPTLAQVNGAAFGGGVGLVACCDVAVGAAGAKFGLTEVKLGLVPATIAPYVVRAVGPRQARRLFLTAEIIGAEEANRVGLLHDVVPAEELDEAVNRQVNFILKNGPAALAEAKHLVDLVTGRDEASQAELDEQTSELIARLRVSDEGQEGLAAFLEKRKPEWTDK